MNKIGASFQKISIGIQNCDNADKDIIDDDDDDADGGMIRICVDHAGDTKNIGFHNSTGPKPLKNYKATRPASNVGSLTVRERNAI